MTNRRTVGIIVVGTNELRWLEGCLGSLSRSNVDGIDFRIYYVDNASSDGSLRYVDQTFPHVTTIANQSNLGFSGANNVGVRRALADGADYLFLVNPDTSTPTFLVRELVQFMEQWEGYGIVGPLQFMYAPGLPVSDTYNDWTRTALEAGERHVFANDLAQLPSHAEPLSPRAPRTLEHAYVQGSALFTRAQVLREVGFFDEAFHTYYEEVDLCRRARLAGWRVALLTDLAIGHHGGGGTSGSTYRRQHMMRNKYYYLASDIEIPLSAQMRIALKWLLLDLRGQGVGGTSTMPTAFAETAQAMGWLARQSWRVARRRALHRSLRLLPRR